MQVLAIIIGLYVVLTLIIAARYVWIVRRLRKRWREVGQDPGASKFILGTILSSLTWPWTIFWFGFKEFLNEIR